MKIIFRPLEEIKKRTDKTSSSKGNFSEMLTHHLDIARGKVAPPQKPKSQKDVENQGSKTALQSDDATEGLELLKEIDSEYYQKGLKKKTLAESFSSRNSSELNERINKFSHLIESKAKKYNLDPNMLAGLVRQESNFNPYAVSHCGAMGLGQLMPETARYLGVKDPFNAAQNLDGCAKYLREQLDNFGGNTDKALAAYNAGPGAVKKYGGIPPYAETRNYVSAIRSHANQITKLEIFSLPKSQKV